MLVPARRLRRTRRAAILGAAGLLVGGVSAAPVLAQEDTVAVARLDTLAIVDSLRAAVDTLQDAHPQDSPDST
ncbi:MAG: hypothetical protein HKP01_00095, partial [Gemmatimonadetes bacterium]|nr:hypothetical protein [Gemmatimonadota bacterium]